MEAVSLKGAARKEYGSAASKRIRKAGQVPAVIYQDGDAIHMTLDPKELKPLIYTPKFKVADIELDGKTYRCIVKEIQFHPKTDEILHIDFQQLIEGTSIKVQIPIELTGQAVGVKTGGKLYQKVRRAKIKTNAENLIDKIQLDVSELELGQSVRIRDIDEIDGIQIMNSAGIPVASVETPRALRSAKDAALEEEGAEGEEGEGEEGGESAEGGDE